MDGVQRGLADGWRGRLNCGQETSIKSSGWAAEMVRQITLTCAGGWLQLRARCRHLFSEDCRTCRPPEPCRLVTNGTFPISEPALEFAHGHDTRIKYRCMQCDMTEDKCDCEKYCCSCQGQIDIRLCSDGLTIALRAGRRATTRFRIAELAEATVPRLSGSVPRLAVRLVPAEGG